MKTLWLALIAFLCMLGCFGLELEIRLPETPETWEKHAADNLRKYLSESIQDKITVNGKKAVFHVGKTAAAKALNWTPQDEEWTICTDGGNVILYGGGSRGTLYAVSVFLEKYVGMRYYNMQEKLIPKHQSLALGKIRETGKPVFILRSMYPDYREKRDNGDFAVFNRINGFGPVSISAENGGSMNYGTPYHVHTFGKYISRKEFYAKHPEYFALQKNGKRNPDPVRGQLCLSNPELLDIFWEKLKNNILKDEKEAAAKGMPTPAIYDISQNDNNSFCMCNNCKALRKNYDNREAGLQLRLVNELAKRMKQFRPKLKISTLAYFQTETPPKKFQLEDNVLIRLCNTANNYAGSPTAPEEAPFRARISSWNKLAQQLSIWDYGVNFNKTAMGLPYPSEFFLQETLQFYRDQKISFLFTETEHIFHSDMHVMKTWLRAKLMENPDADFPQLMQDFLQGYYGPAASFILQYRQTLLKSVQKNKPYCTAWDPAAISFAHLDLNTVTDCDRLLEKAELAVKDNPVYLRRVREARASIDEAIFIFIRKYNLENPKNQLNAASARKRLSEALKNASEFFMQSTDNARQYCKQNISRLDAYDSLPLHIPAQNIVPGGIDLPIELTNWWAGGDKLVLDKDSTLGYAVKVNQRKMPMHIGGYDKQIRASHYFSDLKAKDIKGPGYHWYKFRPFAPRPAGYIYLTNDWHVQFPQSLAAMKNSSVKWTVYASIKFAGFNPADGKADKDAAIYIDRIVLAPEQATSSGGK